MARRVENALGEGEKKTAWVDKRRAGMQDTLVSRPKVKEGPSLEEVESFPLLGPMEAYKESERTRRGERNGHKKENKVPMQRKSKWTLKK